MKRMIEEYEQCRAQLLERIHSLNEQLRQGEVLGNIERDDLLLRRSLLMAERTELLRDIREMQEHVTDAERRACAC